jgi:hypothetical protein
LGKKSLLSWPTLILPFVTEDRQSNGVLNCHKKITHFCLQGTLPFSQSMNQKLLMHHTIQQMKLSAILPKDMFSRVFINSSFSEHLLVCLVLTVAIER